MRTRPLGDKHVQHLVSVDSTARGFSSPVTATFPVWSRRCCRPTPWRPGPTPQPGPWAALHRWRRSARACRSPAPRSGGTADRGRMGGAGLDRQGGDIGDLHPPGARPDVQANHMSGLSPAIGALITAALSDHSQALSKGRCVNRIPRRARRCGRGTGRVRPPGRLPGAHRCPGEDRAGDWAPDRRPVHRQRCGGDHRRCAGCLGGHRVRYLSPCRALRTGQRGVRGRGRGCAPGVVGARGRVRAVRPRRLQSAVRAA